MYTDLDFTFDSHDFTEVYENFLKLSKTFVNFGDMPRKLVQPGIPGLIFGKISVSLSFLIIKQ